MPTQPITYKDAQRQYPALVEQVMAQLRKSKSKQKNAKPEDLTWYYVWSTRIQSDTIHEIMDGRAMARQQAWKSKSADEQLADKVKACNVCLSGKVGHACYVVQGVWNGETGEGEIPAEIRLWYRNIIDQQKSEEARIAGLTDEQRNAEIAENLKELSGSPGFFGVRVHG